MSIKHNIFANYFGQFYVTILNILVFPVYLHYMGAEAFGLVGFFSLMQSWFQLLDIGLSPTLGREVARFRGGAMSGSDLRRLLKVMEAIFYSTAIIGSVAIVLLSWTIAGDWLKVQTLTLAQVAGAVALMGLAVGIRWISSIYRSAISGFEQQVWLNTYNSIIATIRFIPIIPVFIYVSTSPLVFFSYQLLIAGLELAGLAIQCHRLMPAGAGHALGWSLAPLKDVYKFSLTYAVTSAIWILVTQVDRLILSKVLPLQEFGFFSLGVLLAAAIGLVSAPISQAILPRLVQLNTSGDEEGLMALYRRATQWVCIATAPATLVMACFAERILWVWTGNWETALKAAPILRLYAIGNGILSVVAFQSYLQYAKGNMRLHLIGNIIFVMILVPLLVWVTRSYGGVGAGYVWVGQGIFYLLVWTGIVHKRFAPGLHWRWLGMDVLPIWLTVLVVTGIASLLNIKLDQSRWQTATILIGLGMGLFVAGALVKREPRAIIWSRVSGFFYR